MSIHPTTTNAEIRYVCESIKAMAENFEEWSKDYIYNRSSNEFTHVNATNAEQERVKEWFKL